MTPNDVLDILDRAKASYELIPHARTETAAEEARELGIRADDVAKTLVVETQLGHVRAVLPASARLDTHKLRAALGIGGKPHLLSEEELAHDYPSFELGSVPPIGGGRSDPVVVDVRVAGHDQIVLEAGSHAESMRLRASDLIMVAGAVVADICADDRQLP